MKDKIKQLRLENGLTVGELAKLINVNKKEVVDIEKGDYSNKDVLNYIKKYFGYHHFKYDKYDFLDDNEKIANIDFKKLKKAGIEL